MQHPTPARFIAAALGVALVTTLAPASAEPSRKRRARVATRYLADRQDDDGSMALFSPVGDTADAVAALVLARRGPRQIEKGLDYLEAHLNEARSIGLVAKIVMAVVAAGGDPRDFGGRDLVAEIQESEKPDGRFGEESDAEVYYHALAMLALVSAGEEPTVHNSAWLLQARCDDGGWQFDEPAGAGDDEHCRESEEDFSGSDTNTTSYVVQAMAVSAGPDATQDSIDYFESARDPIKKGFVYDPTQKCTEDTLGSGCFLTDSNSTSLVLQALARLAQPLPKRAVRALHRLQHPLCGRDGGGVAFTWDYDAESDRFTRQAPNVGSTIAAIPGLLYHAFPLPQRDVTKAPPRRVPCN